jgi:hypothetical protein
LELGPNHRPLQAALSGSLIKAPGFAGGYLQKHEACSAGGDRRSIREPHLRESGPQRRGGVGWWRPWGPWPNGRQRGATRDTLSVRSERLERANPQGRSPGSAGVAVDV